MIDNFVMIGEQDFEFEKDRSKCVKRFVSKSLILVRPLWMSISAWYNCKWQKECHQIVGYLKDHGISINLVFNQKISNCIERECATYDWVFVEIRFWLASQCVKWMKEHKSSKKLLKIKFTVKECKNNTDSFTYRWVNAWWISVKEKKGKTSLCAENVLTLIQKQSVHQA